MIMMIRMIMMKIVMMVTIMMEILIMMIINETHNFQLIKMGFELHDRWFVPSSKSLVASLLINCWKAISLVSVCTL